MSKIGWRAWMTSPAGALTSFYGDIIWPADDYLEATCLNEMDHLVPAENCTCGIYVYKWAEDVEGLLHTGGYKGAAVIGCIEWWGRWEEHEFGYRVQFAQARALRILRGKLHPVYHHLLDPSQSWTQLVERWEESESPFSQESRRAQAEDEVDG